MRTLNFSTIDPDHRALSRRNRDLDSPSFNCGSFLTIYITKIQPRTRCGFERLPVDLFELLHHIFIDGGVEHFKPFPRETSTQVKTTRLLCSCLWCRCGFAPPSNELCTPPNEFAHRQHQTCCTSTTHLHSVCGFFMDPKFQLSAKFRVALLVAELLFAISANTSRHTSTRRSPITRKILLRYKFSRHEFKGKSFESTTPETKNNHPGKSKSQWVMMKICGGCASWWCVCLLPQPSRVVRKGDEQQGGTSFDLPHCSVSQTQDQWYVERCMLFTLHNVRLSHHRS